MDLTAPQFEDAYREVWRKVLILSEYGIQTCLYVYDFLHDCCVLSSDQDSNLTVPC